MRCQSNLISPPGSATCKQALFDEKAAWIKEVLPDLPTLQAGQPRKYDLQPRTKPCHGLREGDLADCEQSAEALHQRQMPVCWVMWQMQHQQVATTTPCQSCWAQRAVDIPLPLLYSAAACICNPVAASRLCQAASLALLG